MCNSRRQLLDCLADGVVKVAHPLPAQSPVECSTNFGAGQPKFDIIYLIDHAVLGVFQSTIDDRPTKNRRLTLIVVRIMLTVPKAALAGAMLAISFARFKVSMATFNAEIVLSRPLGRRDLASMVEARSSGERIVRCQGCEEGSGP